MQKVFCKRFSAKGVLQKLAARTHQSQSPELTNHQNSQSMDITLLEKLKLGTQASHEDVERRVDLMKQLQTASAYRRLLEGFYGLYHPLETEIERAAPQISVWLPDIRTRMRSALLRLDLGVLGNVRPEALPRAPVPVLHGLPEQFGCLYVLEGSSLGGQLIAREVQSRLQYTPERGCAFFNGYGPRTGGMWKAFRQATESFGVSHPDPGIHDRIVHSALAVFGTFGEWIGRAE